MMVMRERAFAKINLYLHIVGRRADGYHLLDSLVVFANVADELAAMPADDLVLALAGPHAHQLTIKENSVLKAAELLRAHGGIITGASLTLTKNLPVTAGIGGGSADAAATLRLLMRLWKIKPVPRGLADIALALGADVPACLISKALYMEGIGEKITGEAEMAGWHLVLANPGKPLATPQVFAAYRGPHSPAARHPRSFASVQAAAGFLHKTRNDLQGPALALMPEIADVLAALEGQQKCLLARMSGSGATCFGLFADAGASAAAARALSARHPAWWVTPAVTQ